MRRSAARFDLDYSLDFVLALLDQRPIRGGYVGRGTAVVRDVPVPKLHFTDPNDVKFHKDVSDAMLALRKLPVSRSPLSRR